MKISKITCAFIGMFLASNVFAGVSVIVHPSQSISSISESDATKIFLGKVKSLPNDSKITPVDQDNGSSTRADFYNKVVGQSASKIKSYWAKRIFTGKGKPPESKGDDNGVKQYVSSNTDAIGYIDSSKVDSSVKAVLTVN